MLRVRAARVRYDDVIALDSVDLDVRDGEVMALLGPSGSGKTTLLRVVAGLEHPEAGAIHWDTDDLSSVPPHRRGFGLMFQDYVLFPHRDVGGNVAFGLRMQAWSAERTDARVAEVLDLVGMGGFENRQVGTLSGGEQQRVALARALAPAPRLLMLDEPLGSLDRPLREQLVGELRDLLSGIGVAALYVTHDQEEAFAVADRLTLMHGGRVVQTGTPQEVWQQPASEVAARFLGFEVVDAEVTDGTAATPWGPVPVGTHIPPGTRRLVIRPDALSVDPNGPIAGTVAGRTFRGGHSVIEVRPEAGPTLSALSKQTMEIGAAVRVAVDPDGIVAL